VTSGTPSRASDIIARRGRIQRWVTALERMSEALKTLDESDGPADVGAHLDLAIERLKTEIATATDSDQS
jgi:hypothetical protein